MSVSRQHSALCFERTFPRSAARHRDAWRQLRNFEDTTRLDEILWQIIQPGEDEYFDSGYVTTRGWIDQARAAGHGADFDWLMAQLQVKRLRPVWTQLYDAAEIPLTWHLRNSRFSRSRNALPAGRVATRENGMRARPRYPKQAICEPGAPQRLENAANACQLRHASHPARGASRE